MQADLENLDFFIAVQTKECLNLSLNFLVAQKRVIVSVDGKQEKMSIDFYSLFRVTIFRMKLEYISIFMFIAHKVLVKSKLAS